MLTYCIYINYKVGIFNSCFFFSLSFLKSYFLHEFSICVLCLYITSITIFCFSYYYYIVWEESALSLIHTVLYYIKLYVCWLKNYWLSSASSPVWLTHFLFLASPLDITIMHYLNGKYLKKRQISTPVRTVIVERFIEGNPLRDDFLTNKGMSLGDTSNSRWAIYNVGTILTLNSYYHMHECWELSVSLNDYIVHWKLLAKHTFFQPMSWLMFFHREIVQLSMPSLDIFIHFFLIDFFDSHLNNLQLRTLLIKSNDFK